VASQGPTTNTGSAFPVDALEALDAATRAIAGVLELDAVLQLIVDRVCELAEARYAALGIVDRYGGIERFITVGVSPEERARIGSPPRGHGLLGLIIREGRSYRIPEIGAHPDSYGFPPNHPPMRSFLGVPVSVQGRTIGNLYLTDKRSAPEFSEADQHLVELFARHAGIAIENARLHEQVQLLAVVEERDRIGQELHDGIIQRLYAVTLSLEDVTDLMTEDPAEASARVDRAIDAVQASIRDIRNFILGLRPHLLERTDLVGGLAALADELRLNTMVDVEVDLDEGVEAAAALGDGRRAQLLQIAREALSNAARHSGASRATVRLVLEDGTRLRLSVEDNGRGFDPGTVRGGEHQGLVNMRDRATHMGGQLEVDSEPGMGARIIVRVPLPSGEPDT
jgi:signal transduction histidine kinase